VKNIFDNLESLLPL